MLPDDALAGGAQIVSVCGAGGAVSVVAGCTGTRGGDVGGRHGTGRRLAGRVRWRGWRDVEGGGGLCGGSGSGQSSSVVV